MEYSAPPAPPVCTALCRANTSMVNGKLYQFTWWDAAMTVITMLFSIFGILSDGVLVYTDASKELWLYFGITLFLALVPTVVINAISISWHIDEKSATKGIWCCNIVLFGTIQRNWALLQAGRKAQKTRREKDFRVLYRHKRDLCVLDIYKSFLKSAPQLVLQLYIMLDTEDWSVPTVTSFARAMVLLPWCMAAYDRTERCCRPEQSDIPWQGTVLQFVWRLGTVGSRVGAMVLRGIADDSWAFLIFGFHLVVTATFAFAVTDLMAKEVAIGLPPWKTVAHCITMGAGFTFGFINAGDSLTNEAGLVLMYANAFEENLESTLTFLRESANRGYPVYGSIAMAAVVTSFCIGVGCMLWYRSSYGRACEVSLFPSRTPIGEDNDEQAAWCSDAASANAECRENAANENSHLLLGDPIAQRHSSAVWTTTQQ